MQNTAENLHFDTPLELQLQPGIINIGQAIDNDIRLPMADISTYHARIVTYFHQAVLVDLSSESGTYLNGERVIKHSLKNGDVIQLGNQAMIVRLTSLL